MTIEYLADRREFIHTVARWHYAEWGHLRPGGTLEDRIARVERDCGHCQIPPTFIAAAGPQPLGSASLNYKSAPFAEAVLGFNQDHIVFL